MSSLCSLVGWLQRVPTNSSLYSLFFIFLWVWRNPLAIAVQFIQPIPCFCSCFGEGRLPEPCQLCRDLRFGLGVQGCYWAVLWRLFWTSWKFGPHKCFFLWMKGKQSPNHLGLEDATEGWDVGVRPFMSMCCSFICLLTVVEITLGYKLVLFNLTPQQPHGSVPQISILEWLLHAPFSLSHWLSLTFYLVSKLLFLICFLRPDGDIFPSLEFLSHTHPQLGSPWWDNFLKFIRP